MDIAAESQLGHQLRLIRGGMDTEHGRSTGQTENEDIPVIESQRGPAKPASPTPDHLQRYIKAPRYDFF